MTGKWASHNDAGTGDMFHTLHAGLTVKLILTERSQLMTCYPHESLSDVVAQNKAQDKGPYDFLPVVESGGGPQGRIIGLFHTTNIDENVRDGRIEQNYAPLSEDYLVGADTSILKFVEDADKKPCRLVTSGPNIVGLAGLSDLQKLPVRAALFALITGFEITMFETIKRGCPNDEDWKSLLSEDRQKKIDEEIQQSRQDDSFVDALLFAQFCDKSDILRKGFLSKDTTAFRKKLKPIQTLRNNLAHANEYAASPDHARKVCASVRDLLTLRKEVRDMTRLDSGVRKIGAMRQEAT